jgi:hypothetical protein
MRIILICLRFCGSHSKLSSLVVTRGSNNCKLINAVMLVQPYLQPRQLLESTTGWITNENNSYLSKVLWFTFKVIIFGYHKGES